MDKASMNSLGLEFSTLGGMVMICTTAAVSGVAKVNELGEQGPPTPDRHSPKKHVGSPVREGLLHLRPNVCFGVSPQQVQVLLGYFTSRTN